MELRVATDTKGLEPPKNSAPGPVLPEDTYYDHLVNLRKFNVVYEEPDPKDEPYVHYRRK